MKALSYIRVSSRGQIDKDGLMRQRLCIAGWADQHGVAIIQEYEEPGVSGTTPMSDREAFMGLFINVQDDESVTHILIESMDRLARDLMVSEFIFSELRRIRPDIKIIECSTGMDLANVDDPSRKFIRQVLAAAAEFNKEALVLRMRAARKRIKAEKGKCEGRKYEVFPMVLRDLVADTMNQPLREAATLITRRGFACDHNRIKRLRERLWAIFNPQKGSQSQESAGAVSAPLQLPEEE